MSPNLADRNRQNAQASTGPKTEVGKARSSRNSLKTGLYSVSALLPNEDKQEYLEHAATYAVELKAMGPVQSDLVKIISDAAWRLRRVRGLESRQAQQVSHRMETMAQRGSSQDQNAQHILEIRNLESLGRHEQRIQNSMFKAMKQLRELQKDAHREQPQTTAAQSPSGFVPKTGDPTQAASTLAPETAPQSTPEISPEVPMYLDPSLQKAVA